MGRCLHDRYLERHHATVSRILLCIFIHVIVGMCTINLERASHSNLYIILFGTLKRETLSPPYT